ncbi:MAG: glycerol-3-phosphate dehydrogenase/oxidase [Acidobacteriota bacterium]|jgi:glycerol-3-phosphate dehydrogenase
MMFHPTWREQALAGLDQSFDLVIVGGGITGCGVLLDAAQRGLRVLLVERGDVASGTSSRSSKLIHGGLRYLKQMQFGVTRQACRERDRMRALDPDLVHPIRFLYPAYEGAATPGWQVDLGLWMYDKLTAGPSTRRRLDADGVRRLAPGLDVEHLERALSYEDAFADDAALTLAVAATGFGYGGLILTRAEAVGGIEGSDGRLAGLELRDLVTGTVHRVEARLVVNAAGVWVDRVRTALGPGRGPEGGSKRGRLRPSRGSHLILPADRLPLDVAVTAPSPDDGRPIFLIPHPEGVLVGTTDVFHEDADGDLDDPRPSRAELDYLLRATAFHFPGRGITGADVVGAFAGLRPILSSDVEDPSEASREEAIWEERGLLTVAGGKLTTWRQMAEEAVDEALEHLPESRTAHLAPCHTRGTPLVGLAPLDLAERLTRAHRVDPVVASGMARRLRSAAWWAPELARRGRELRPMAEGTDLTAAEVRVHLRFGAVVHLEDLLLRRARVGLWRPDRAREIAPLLRPLFRQELGWSRRRFERELEGFERALVGWSPEGVTA